MMSLLLKPGPVNWARKALTTQGRFQARHLSLISTALLPAAGVSPMTTIGLVYGVFMGIVLVQVVSESTTTAATRKLRT
jgi:hypothetical protein